MTSMVSSRYTMDYASDINDDQLFKSVNRFEEWLKEAKLDKKSHQMDAIVWCLMRELMSNSKIEQSGDKIRGGILADEMGLGKTILMLGCMASNPKAKTLIVVPSPLLDQWRKCIVDFLGCNAYIHHGTNKDYTRLRLKDSKGTSLKGNNGAYLRYAVHKESKEISKINPDNYNNEGNQRFEELKKKVVVKTKTTKTLNDSPIVLTTYGMISMRKKKDYVSPVWKIKWDRIIYDEAHHMRNHKSNSFKGALKIPAQIKWFVTGTPIQNYEKDLNSLLNLLGIGRYLVGNNQDFEDSLKYYILKRTKKSVGIDMPNLTMETINVPVTDDSEFQLLTQLHAEASFSNVTVENVDEIMQMFDGKGPAIYTACRQSCIYPSLLTDKWTHLLAHGMVDLDVQVPAINTHSKLTAVVNKIIERKRTGKKIVFCHYRGEIDKIALMLSKAGITAHKYDGRTTKKNRRAILNSSTGWSDMFLYNRFNIDIQSSAETLKMLIEPYLSNDVLIMQIKSGCEGLNLQDYNEVYFVSPHWNPAVEDQAIARAYRIGQKKPVSVFRFVTELKNKNSVIERDAYRSLDSYCLLVQEKKRELIEQLDDIVMNA